MSKLQEKMASMDKPGDIVGIIECGTCGFTVGAVEGSRRIAAGKNLIPGPVTAELLSDNDERRRRGLAIRNFVLSALTLMLIGAVLGGALSTIIAFIIKIFWNSSVLSWYLWGTVLSAVLSLLTLISRPEKECQAEFSCGECHTKWVNKFETGRLATCPKCRNQAIISGNG